MRRASAVLAVAAVVAGLVFAGPRALDAIRGLHRPFPARPAASAVSGTFTRTVGPATGPLRDNRMAGIWTMRFRGGVGEIVSAPKAFRGVISGYDLRMRPTMMRTNLFIQDVCAGLPVGTYRWSVSGGVLTFTTIHDTCAARSEFLTAGAWRQVH
jgi:hypothetical protein